MSYQLRGLAEEEVDALHEAMSLAFHFDPKDEWRDQLAKFLEWERTFGVFDADEMVGTGGVISFELTVPGGSQRAGGLTIITVRPTHRRRGILTQMMRHHLEDGRTRGENVAILHASEAVIYQRFGYGLAIEPYEYVLDRRHAALRSRSPKGTVRLVPTEKAMPPLRTVYEAVGTVRPGWIARTDDWWQEHIEFDPESVRDGFTRRLYAVYEEAGAPLGYAQYRTKGDWTDGMPQGTVRVTELVGATVDAEWALWNYLISIDLIQTIKAYNRAPDDVLPLLLIDRRRLRRAVEENLWLRIIDVPGALAGRCYADTGTLVLEVEDGFMPENTGRYLLQGGPTSATCRPTTEAADITVDIADLGSWYLGGEVPSRFAASGRAQGSADAFALADAMFRWTPGPWCIQHF